MFAAVGIDERRDTNTGRKRRLPLIAYVRSDEATAYMVSICTYVLAHECIPLQDRYVRQSAI